MIGNKRDSLMDPATRAVQLENEYLKSQVKALQKMIEDEKNTDIKSCISYRIDNDLSDRVSMNKSIMKQSVEERKARFLAKRRELDQLDEKERVENQLRE